MTSTSSRQRRKAKRKAARERIAVLLVNARLDGFEVEHLKGLAEYELHKILGDMRKWREIRFTN